MTSHVLDFLGLATPGVRGLTPYQPGKPVAELEREYGIRNAIKLASNENPFGPSPLALEAAVAAMRDIARYPEGSSHELVTRLARHHGVEPACITPGNGSNDVLELVARAFLEPGVGAVFSQHAFAVYPIVVQATGARAQVAPARDWGHDLDAMHARVDSSTRVVFIANPNNPTGTYLAADQLRDFIASLPAHVIVVVDEAYFEYVGRPDYPDTSQWLEDFPGLIVTRTFSKAYALASLRVGYALSHPRVAGLLNRVRQPFNVNAIAQAAATAALEDREHLATCVQRNRAGMQQLACGFRDLGLSSIESAGNFIAVDTGRDAGKVYEAMLRKGVIVRPVAGYGMPRHLRVTVGSPDDNASCLAAFGEVLGD